MNIVKYFLPEKLLEHFTITDFYELGSVSSKKMFFEIHLEENNQLPTGYDLNQYESKGFYPAKTIQDFPVRDIQFHCNLTRQRQTENEICRPSILPECLNFYSTALFRQSRFGYPTLQHICKPTQAIVQTEGLQKSCNFAHAHAQSVFFLFFCKF